ncbi:MAG: LamG domain-containing protein, partial [Patescibacteria group bacterium]
MSKYSKKFVNKVGRFLLVFVWVFVWVFSGWFENYNFLPKIQEAKAAASYFGKGTFDSGNGAITLTVPASYASGTLMFIIAESENEDIVTPNGWTNAPGSPKGTGTAKAAGAVRLEVFYRWATSSASIASTVIADSGDHTAGIMFGVNGIDTSNPFNTWGAGVDASATTSIFFPSVTTTIANALILNLIGLDKDGADSDTMQSGANARLTSFTEQHDQTVSTGDGGGVGFFTGFLASAGSTGTTTATGDTATTYAYITLALNPETSPDAPTLSRPENATTTTITTPVLIFTGTDPNSDNLEYNVQVDTSINFDSQGSNPVVYFDPGSDNGQGTIYAGAFSTRIGEVFNSSGGVLTSCKFRLVKNGSPTGNMYAYLYNVTGAYGTDAVPTGSPLATSNAVLASTTVTTPGGLVEFTFSDSYLMTSGTKYAIEIVYNEGGDASNYINVRLNVGISYEGNRFLYSTSYSGFSTDAIFYVYSSATSPVISASSTQHTGFSGGASHPYASGAEVTYTVQSALDPGTYYWRVAAIDPDGSNTYGDWSETRSFTVSTGNSAPAVSISQPPAEGATITQGDNYTVTYTLSDTDSTVTSTFYYDTNASGYDGTIIAGCTGVAEGTNTTCAWDTTGVSPGSYYVYGSTTDYISAPVRAYSLGSVTIESVTSSASFSLGVWVKPTNSFASKALAVKDNEIRLVTNASGQPICQIHNGTAWQAGATSTTALALGSWQYVSCVYDRSTLKIYINTIQTATVVMSGVDINDSTSTLDLGHDAGGGYADFQGYIDEFKYYKYARSAAQIKSDYIGIATKKGAVIRSVTVGEQDDQSQGLVAYYKFDETSFSTVLANVLDSSGNGNHLTAKNNASATTTAKFGGAASYDGADDYLCSDPNNDGACEDNNNMDITGALTIEAWVKFDAIGLDLDWIAGKYGGWNGFCKDDSNRLRFYSDTGAHYGYSQIFTWETDKWYHLAMKTVDGTIAGLKFYRDGVEYPVTVVAEGSIVASDGAFYTGTWYDGSHDFQGQIDDLKIYKTARTAEQIRRDYDTGPPAVAHWKMDEKTGQYAYDSSGNGNNGVLGSGDTSDSADPQWKSGKYGSALKFDGDNDDVLLTSSSQLAFSGNVDYTISGWVKTSTSAYPTTYSAFAGKWGDASIGYMIFFDDLGGIRIYSDASYCYTPFSTSYPADGKWHYLVGTKSGSVGQIYLDGVPLVMTVSTFSDNTITDMTGKFEIGSYNSNSGNNFAGLVDDVRVYNYARTPKQILEDMNAGHPSVGSPVGSYVAYWPLDEGQGATAYDKSINQSNLTLNSASWTKNGKFGGAWNGTSTNWLSRADDDDFDFTQLENFSISMWAKSDATANPSTKEFLLRKASSSAGYGLFFDNLGYPTFGIDDDTTWNPDATTSAQKDFYDGAW